MDADRLLSDLQLKEKAGEQVQVHFPQIRLQCRTLNILKKARRLSQQISPQLTFLSIFAATFFYKLTYNYFLHYHFFISIRLL